MIAIANIAMPAARANPIFFIATSPVFQNHSCDIQLPEQRDMSDELVLFASDSRLHVVDHSTRV
jgi:hypothetical protein